MQTGQSSQRNLAKIVSESHGAAKTNSTASSIAERMDMVRWLVGAMMVGQACGLRASASEIYQATATLTKDIDSVHMCLAFSSALGGEPGFVKELSSKGFDGCPNADHLNLAMAHTLEMIGDSDWKLFARKVVEVSESKILVESAKRMLKNAG
jgi:hypothetical protein